MGARLNVVAACMFIGSAAFGNVLDRPYKTVSDSELTEKIDRHDADAIRELGYRKSHPRVSKLKEIAEQDQPPQDAIQKFSHGKPALEKKYRHIFTRNYAVASQAAKMALAKLGDEVAFNEFVVGLSTSNPDYRSDCILALGYIGNKSAVKDLGPILLEKGGPPVRSKDDWPTPYSTLAEMSLGNILPNVLSDIQKKNPTKRIHFHDEWKSWWNANKDQYK